VSSGPVQEASLVLFEELGRLVEGLSSGRTVVMGRGEALMKEVRQALDPPSLVYFAKVTELAAWVDGDLAERERLEKRWHGRYVAHRKRRKAQVSG
jgi:hypothetical protein